MPELQPGTTMYRIGELERVTRELRQDVRELRGGLELAEQRIRELEGQTPQAQQLQLEADQAAADLAESGYDRHGRDCWCSYCATDEPDPGEYDPGPEAGDEGAMSEYRPGNIAAEPWS
jgi:hypothetical protein